MRFRAVRNFLSLVVNLRRYFRSTDMRTTSGSRAGQEASVGRSGNTVPTMEALRIDVGRWAWFACVFGLRAGVCVLGTRAVGACRGPDTQEQLQLGKDEIS